MTTLTWPVRVNDPMTHKERKLRRKAMADDVRSGSSPADVSGKYGVSEATVLCACREFKLSRKISRSRFVAEFPKRYKRAKDTLRIAAALINTEDTQTEIAERFNVSKAWVSLIYIELRELGVKVPERNRWT